jgi:hypothetical protein
MHCHRDAPGASGVAVRSGTEVAEIARRFGAEFCQRYRLSPEQQRALGDIVLCRTAALGGHLDECPQCGHQRPSYNSCLNRHCPKCGWTAAEKWLEKRQQRLLPTHHFHVVFTVPAELRALFTENRELLYGLLFRSAAGALVELGADPKRLGGQPGITAVLHTWTRDLLTHPHLHCLVTGGALGTDGQWNATRPGFLFPARVLGKLFCGKFLHSLKSLYDRGLLRITGRCEPLADRSAFARYLDRLYRKKWRPYTKKPFSGADGVCRYLARYTHRSAISNRRLLCFDDQQVIFRTRGDKTTCLPPVSFLQRFFAHVLPPGFVRIRHYGLYAAGNVNTRLEQARALLASSISGGCEPADVEQLAEHEQPDFVRIMLRVFGVDPTKCPRCGTRMRCVLSVPRPRFFASPNRSPPPVR